MTKTINQSSSHFYNTISNYLTNKQIKNEAEYEWYITTEHIHITTEAIISSHTGEIYIEYTNTDIILKNLAILDMLINYSKNEFSSIKMEGGEM